MPFAAAGTHRTPDVTAGECRGTHGHGVELRDEGLGDLRFRALVHPDEWAGLPPHIRRRFSKRLAGGRTIVSVGEVVETREIEP